MEIHIFLQISYGYNQWYLIYGISWRYETKTIIPTNMIYTCPLISIQGQHIIESKWAARPDQTRPTDQFPTKVPP